MTLWEISDAIAAIEVPIRIARQALLPPDYDIPHARELVRDAEDKLAALKQQLAELASGEKG